MTVYGVGEDERGMVLVYNYSLDGGYMEKHIGYMSMHCTWKFAIYNYVLDLELF